MKKIIWISISTIIIAAVYLLYFNDDTETSEMVNPLERTEKVTRDNLVVTVSAVGTVEPKQAVDVKSKASGQIMRIEVDEGDFVTKGELICILDKTTAINDFRQA
ncbi:MAG: biotin/lipoyl-binding protein, partial [candidate division Zixibacteria bacterium]|nr:biotin/lipoyl-binding protein [candidate division Zixibacteria bacterium]